MHNAYSEYIQITISAGTHNRTEIAENGCCKSKITNYSTIGCLF